MHKFLLPILFLYSSLQAMETALVEHQNAEIKLSTLTSTIFGIADIEEVRYGESGNNIIYIAHLKNGERVYADYCIKGPKRGECFCRKQLLDSRNLIHVVALPPDTYNVLDEWYKKNQFTEEEFLGVD